MTVRIAKLAISGIFLASLAISPAIAEGTFTGVMCTDPEVLFDIMYRTQGVTDVYPIVRKYRGCFMSHFPAATATEENVAVEIVKPFHATMYNAGGDAMILFLSYDSLIATR